LANLSTVRKVGILARVLGRQAGKSRFGAAVLTGLRATISSFARILHQLWLEVTGFVFLALALIGGLAVPREYVKYQAGQQGPARLLVALCFCLTFGYFGLSSFWRVRKKQ
jgi:hypothetical protein